MNQVYYAANEELGALEKRADELQAERSTGLVTRLWQTEVNPQKSDCWYRHPGYNQQQLQYNKQYR